MPLSRQAHLGFLDLAASRLTGQLESSEEGSDSLSAGCPADGPGWPCPVAAVEVQEWAPSEPHPGSHSVHRPLGACHAHPRRARPRGQPCAWSLGRGGQGSRQTGACTTVFPTLTESSRRPPTFHVTRTRSSTSGAVGLQVPPFLVGKPPPWGGAQVQGPTSSWH